MEHCSPTAWANDLKITRTGVAIGGQHKHGHGKSKEGKDHLFLFFTFVTIVSLSFSQKVLALSIPLKNPLDLDSQELGSIFEINFLEYSVG